MASGTRNLQPFLTHTLESSLFVVCTFWSPHMIISSGDICCTSTVMSIRLAKSLAIFSLEFFIISPCTTWCMKILEHTFRFLDSLVAQRRLVWRSTITLQVVLGRMVLIDLTLKLPIITMSNLGGLYELELAMLFSISCSLDDLLVIYRMVIGIPFTRYISISGVVLCHTSGGFINLII